MRSAPILKALADTAIDLPGLRKAARKAAGDSDGMRGGDRRAWAEIDHVLHREIAVLNLDARSAARLLSDTALIIDWYRAPWNDAAAMLEPPIAVRALNKVRAAADAMTSLSCGDLRQADQLLHHGSRYMPSSGGRPVDVIRLQADLKRLAHDIGETLAVFDPPTGRRLTLRRDRCLALLADAVAACGKRVGLSADPGNKKRHFHNDAGRFVLAVMNVVGWSDEHHLAGAFARAHRASKKRD